jgi:hypothetical protein
MKTWQVRVKRLGQERRQEAATRAGRTITMPRRIGGASVWQMASPGAGATGLMRCSNRA